MRNFSKFDLKDTRFIRILSKYGVGGLSLSGVHWYHMGGIRNGEKAKARLLYRLAGICPGGGGQRSGLG